MDWFSGGRSLANSTPLTDGLPTGTVAFAYDTIGRPISESLTVTSGGGQTYTVGYTAYDDDSRLTTLTYPDGSTVMTTYTDRNQAEDIDYTPSGASAFNIARMTYDAGMRQTLRELGNGLEEARAYRDDNLLESITVETGPGNDDRQGLSFDYTYDANKNMTAEDTGGVMDDYGVDLIQDAKDRMTSWTRDTTDTALDSQSWTLSYESDWNASTLTDAGTAVTQTRTHNASHELLTIDPDGSDPQPAFSQTHDAKGNLTADGDGLTHTFDFDNMLKQTVVTSSSPRGIEGTHTYEYDALGRRVSKTVTPTGGSATTTVFVLAGQQVIAEYTGGSGAADTERKYIYSRTGYIDEPIAMIDASGSGEDTYYYHRNRQFSIIGLTDDTGTVIERYAYTAYGEVTVLDSNATADADNISDVDNPYTYTGRRLDDETGLLYFRARYHDPVLGRFLERDPLGYPDGLNTYASYYVMWGGVDPMGTEVWLDQSRHHKTVDRVYKHRKDADYSKAGIRKLTISWKASATQVNSNTVKVTLEAKSTAGVSINVLDGGKLSTQVSHSTSTSAANYRASINTMAQTISSDYEIEEGTREVWDEKYKVRYNVELWCARWEDGESPIDPIPTTGQRAYGGTDYRDGPKMDGWWPVAGPETVVGALNELGYPNVESPHILLNGEAEPCTLCRWYWRRTSTNLGVVEGSHRSEMSYRVMQGRNNLGEFDNYNAVQGAIGRDAVDFAKRWLAGQ